MKSYYQHGIPLYATYGIATVALCGPASRDVILVPDKKGTYLKNQQQKEQSRHREGKLLKKF